MLDGLAPFECNGLGNVCQLADALIRWSDSWLLRRKGLLSLLPQVAILDQAIGQNATLVVV